MAGLHHATTRQELHSLLKKHHYDTDEVIILDAPASVSAALFGKYLYIICLVTIHDGGHHWLCLYKHPSKSSSVCVFDSYGLNPEHNSFYDIREVIRDPQVVICRSTHYTGFQAPSTAVCGEYCVGFILCGGSVENMRKQIGLTDVNDSQLLNAHGNVDKNPQHYAQAIENDKQILHFVNEV